MPLDTTLPWQHAVAGVVSGVFSKSILQPLDLVKTRMQVQRSGLAAGLTYNGFLSAFPTIVRQEGVSALYIGLWPNLVGSGVAWGAYFGFYNIAKRLWVEHRGPDQPLGPLHHLSSAAVAGVATCFLTNPSVTCSRFRAHARPDPVLTGSGWSRRDCNSSSGLATRTATITRAWSTRSGGSHAKRASWPCTEGLVLR